MSKYRVNTDPYFDSDNNTLKNKLGVINAKELELVEDELVLIRTVELLKDNCNELYSVDDFCELHRRMFQDVYDWAGNFRIVDIVKGASRFCHFIYIEREMQRLFVEFERDELDNLDNREFAVCGAQL
ncbi:MAG: Fic family protein [Negativicutes bacterium]|jgi:cell filamentation protein